MGTLIIQMFAKPEHDFLVPISKYYQKDMFKTIGNDYCPKVRLASIFL